MWIYQVKNNKIRKIEVRKTMYGYQVLGLPIALQPNQKYLFAKLEEAKAYLQERGI